MSKQQTNAVTPPMEDDDDDEKAFLIFFSFWCFGLFFAYLALLPVLGMLIDGIVFVYVLMGVLGGWDGKKPLVHAVIAVITIGSMWSLFTFGLGVMLPPGMFMDLF